MPELPEVEHARSLGAVRGGASALPKFELAPTPLWCAAKTAAEDCQDVPRDHGSSRSSWKAVVAAVGGSSCGIGAFGHDGAIRQGEQGSAVGGARLG